jgi:S1-C subfamily serine protease
MGVGAGGLDDSGPLLDSVGNVVGINTAIFTRSGFSSGIGFAIPINTARRIVPQLIANGVVSLPSLNVQLASAKVAKQLAVPAGALIQAVAPGSAAAQAGLLPTRRGLAGILVGDVVVAVDGVPIKDAAALDDAVQTRAVGDRVTLKVSRRDGSKEEIKELVVELQEQIG